MGSAVYVASSNEFYVIGGETDNGPGADSNGVYNRVDIYNPTTNKWRQGPNMPTARHGIYPVMYQSAIYVAGGGVKKEWCPAEMGMGMG
jgi:N-acetylneuraminic acid mutarotase